MADKSTLDSMNVPVSPANPYLSNVAGRFPEYQKYLPQQDIDYLKDTPRDLLLKYGEAGYNELNKAYAEATNQYMADKYTPRTTQETAQDIINSVVQGAVGSALSAPGGAYDLAASLVTVPAKAIKAIADLAFGKHNSLSNYMDLATDYAEMPSKAFYNLKNEVVENINRPSDVRKGEQRAEGYLQVLQDAATEDLKDRLIASGKSPLQAGMKAIFEDIGNTFQSVSESPFIATENIASGIGSLIGLGWSSKLVSLVAKAAGKSGLKNKGNTLLSLSAGLGDVKSSALETFKSIPIEELKQTPEYIEQYNLAIKENLSPEEAQERALSRLENKFTSTAGLTAAPFLAFSAGLEGPTLTKLLNKSIGKKVTQTPDGNTVKSIAPLTYLKDLTKETISEGLEEGSSAFATNVATQQYVDPEQSLTAGVGRQFTLGALGGGAGLGVRSAPTALAVGATTPFKLIASSLNKVNNLRQNIKAKKANSSGSTTATKEPFVAEQPTFESDFRTNLKEEVSNEIRANENLSDNLKEDSIDSFNDFVDSIELSEEDRDKLPDDVKDSTNKIDAIERLSIKFNEAVASKNLEESVKALNAIHKLSRTIPNQDSMPDEWKNLSNKAKAYYNKVTSTLEELTGPKNKILNEKLEIVRAKDRKAIEEIAIQDPGSITNDQEKIVLDSLKYSPQQTPINSVRVALQHAKLNPETTSLTATQQEVLQNMVDFYDKAKNIQKDSAKETNKNTEVNPIEAFNKDFAKTKEGVTGYLNEYVSAVANNNLQRAARAKRNLDLLMQNQQNKINALKDAKQRNVDPNSIEYGKTTKATFSRLNTRTKAFDPDEKQSGNIYYSGSKSDSYLNKLEQEFNLLQDTVNKTEEIARKQAKAKEQAKEKAEATSKKEEPIKDFKDLKDVKSSIKTVPEKTENTSTEPSKETKEDTTTGSTQQTKPVKEEVTSKEPETKKEIKSEESTKETSKVEPTTSKETSTTTKKEDSVKEQKSNTEPVSTTVPLNAFEKERVEKVNTKNEKIIEESQATSKESSDIQNSIEDSRFKVYKGTDKASVAKRGILKKSFGVQHKNTNDLAKNLSPFEYFENLADLPIKVLSREYKVRNVTPESLTAWKNVFLKDGIAERIKNNIAESIKSNIDFYFKDSKNLEAYLNNPEKVLTSPEGVFLNWAEINIDPETKKYSVEFPQEILESISLAAISWLTDTSNQLRALSAEGDVYEIMKRFNLTEEDINTMDFTSLESLASTVPFNISEILLANKIKSYLNLTQAEDVPTNLYEGLIHSLSLLTLQGIKNSTIKVEVVDSTKPKKKQVNKYNIPIWTSEYTTKEIPVFSEKVVEYSYKAYSRKENKEVDFKASIKGISIEKDIKSVFMKIPNFDSVLKPHTQSFFIGILPEGQEHPFEVQTNILHSSSKVSDDSIKQLENSNKVKWHLNTSLLNLYNALSDKGLIKLFGNDIPEHIEDTSRFNRRDLISKKSQNNVILEGLAELKYKSDIVDFVAETEGLDTEEVPIYYNHAIHRAGREQNLDGINPVGNKLVRQAITCTSATIDLSKKSNPSYKLWAITMAQNLGLKITNKPIKEVVKEVEKVFKQLEANKAMLDYLLNPTNTEFSKQQIEAYYKKTGYPATESSLTSLANENAPIFLAKNLEKLFNDLQELGVEKSFASLNAILDYAKYSATSRSKRKAFKTHIMFESDGTTNGSINYLFLYKANGTITEEFVRAAAMGGVFIGKDTDLNTYRGKGNTQEDVYTQAALKVTKKVTDMFKEAIEKDDFDKVLAIISTYIYISCTTDEGEGVTLSKVLVDLLKLPKADVKEAILRNKKQLLEQGSLEISRTFAKLPVTVLNYFSSTGGLSENALKESLKNLYSRMSAGLHSIPEEDYKDLTEEAKKTYFEDKGLLYKAMFAISFFSKSNDIVEKDNYIIKKYNLDPDAEDIGALIRGEAVFNLIALEHSISYLTTGTYDSFKFTASNNQIITPIQDEFKALKENIKNFFAEPLEESVTEILGGDNKETAQMAISVVNAQAQLLDIVLKGQTSKVLESKEINKTDKYNLQNSISLKEKKSFLKKNLIKLLVPNWSVDGWNASFLSFEKNPNTTVTIASLPNTKGKNNPDYNYVYRAEGWISSVKPTGVSPAPLLTLGGGDGTMQQLISIMGMLGLNTYDGFSMAIDKISEYAPKVNKAVQDSWSAKVAEATAIRFWQLYEMYQDSSLVKELKDATNISTINNNPVDVIFEQLAYDMSTKVLNLDNETFKSLTTSEILDLADKHFIKTVANARAFHRALKEIPLSNDQMAGAQLPYKQNIEENLNLSFKEAAELLNTGKQLYSDAELKFTKRLREKTIKKVHGKIEKVTTNFDGLLGSTSSSSTQDNIESANEDSTVTSDTIQNTLEVSTKNDDVDLIKSTESEQQVTKENVEKLVSEESDSENKFKELFKVGPSFKKVFSLIPGSKKFIQYVSTKVDTRENLEKYLEDNGIDSSLLTDADGAYVPELNTILVIVEPEMVNENGTLKSGVVTKLSIALEHEIVHAFTLKKISLILSKWDSYKNTEAGKNLSLIREAMDAFINLDLKKIGNRLIDYKVEINSIRSLDRLIAIQKTIRDLSIPKDNSESAKLEAEIKAISEFIAYGLTERTYLKENSNIKTESIDAVRKLFNSSKESILNLVKKDPKSTSDWNNYFNNFTNYISSFLNSVKKLALYFIYGKTFNKAPDTLYDQLRFNTSIIVSSIPTEETANLDIDSLLQHRDFNKETQHLNNVINTIQENVVNPLSAKIQTFKDDTTKLTPRLKSFIEDPKNISDYFSSNDNSDKILNKLKNLGYTFTNEEQTAFSYITSGLSFMVNPEVNRAEPVAVPNNTPSTLLELNKLKNTILDTLRTSKEKEHQDLYNSLVDINDSVRNLKDNFNRGVELSTFIGLAMVNPKIRETLDNLNITYKGATFNTKNSIEKVGIEMLKVANKKLQGATKNSLSTLDDLTNQLFSAKANYEFNRNINSFINNLNDSFVSAIDKTAQAVLAKLNNKNLKSAKLSKLASVMTYREGQESLGEPIKEIIGRSKINYELRSLLTDFTGISKKSVVLYKTIKKIKSELRKRNEDKIKFSNGLRDKFTTELTEDQEAQLSKCIIKTDLQALWDTNNSKDLSSYFSGSNTDTIASLEKSLPSAQRKLYIKKAKQLANYMINKDPKDNLLRNSYAIARLLNEQGELKELPDENVIKTIDKLVSLYAIDLLSKEDRQLMTDLFNSDIEGMQAVLNSVREQTREDIAQAVESKALYNFYKGHVYKIQKDETSVIVAPTKNEDELRLKGYTKLADYSGSTFEFKTKKSYYISKVSFSSRFNQGGLMSVHNSALGVETSTGYSSDFIGYIPTNKKMLANYRLNHNQDSTAKEPVLPVFNEEGKLVGLEPTMYSDMIKKANRDESIFNVYGAWASRKVEENYATKSNKDIIDYLANQAKEDMRIGKDSEYVNIFSKDLPKSFKDALNILPPDVRKYMLSKFKSGDAFYVKRNDLRNFLGSYSASVTDFVTGRSNWSPETQKLVRNSLVSIFGPNVFVRLKQAEKFTQGAVTAAKDIIVIKSTVIPVANTVSNIGQLMTRGIPLTLISAEIPKKVKELNAYLTTESKRVNLVIEKRSLNPDLPEQAKRIKAIDQELKSMEDIIKELSIYPLIENGEFSTISDVDTTEIDHDILSGRFGEKIEQAIDSLPSQSLADLIKLGMVSRDTELYKLLQKSVQYSDFIAKSIYFDYLRNEGVDRETSDYLVMEEFVNYDLISGRYRDYLETMGMVWFTNYMLRTTKIGINLVFTRPINALLFSILSTAMPATSLGSPIIDNILGRILDGTLLFSTGWDQILRAAQLHPAINVIN